MARIIAISGKARSGKTTAANYICSKISGKCAIESFAIPLKLLIVKQFGDQVTNEDIIHHKDKILIFGDKKMTLRQLMIKVGRMYREIDQDFWVKQVLAKISEHEEQGCDYIIIDDMRYASEHTILNRKNAMLVRVQRNGVEFIDDESETALDNAKFHHVIENNHSFASYYKSLDIIVDGIKAGTWR